MNIIQRQIKSMVVKDRKQLFFLLIFGIILGGLVGIIGALFQIFIHLLMNVRVEFLKILPQSLFLKILISCIFSVVLICGAIYITKKYAPEAAGSGVQEIEGTLEDFRPMIPKRILPIKFLAGAMSLASGLTLGREGPTIQIGGALGKFLSNRFGLKGDRSKILIAAGAGAGLATAFNAPFSGIIFVIEEMHKQFKYTFISLQAVIVTSIVSIFFLHVILGNHIDIHMQHFASLDNSSLWIFIVFGSIFGVFGKVFNSLILKCLDFFDGTIGKRFWILVILFAILIGTCVIVFPDAIGEGYSLMPKVLGLKIGFMALGILFIVRFGMICIAYGTGAPGGIFAPMIALGTIFGVWFGHIVNLFFPHIGISPAVFAVAGMSALFTSTVGAPLTGIILVLEMTFNFALILPLMLTCFSASFIGAIFNVHPIYETLLHRTMVKSPDNCLKHKWQKSMQRKEIAIEKAIEKDEREDDCEKNIKTQYMSIIEEEIDDEKNIEESNTKKNDDNECSCDD